jgi:anti-sigma factor RsiW
MRVAGACASTEPLLSAWLDGALTPRELARVGEHLAACRRCRAEADALRVTATLLRNLPPRLLPAPLPGDPRADVRWRRAALPVAGGRRVARAGTAATATLALALASALGLLALGDETPGPGQVVVPLDAFVVDHVGRAPAVPGSGPMTVEIGR